jgi:hypothetical protein
MVFISIIRERLAVYGLMIVSASAETGLEDATLVVCATLIGICNVAADCVGCCEVAENVGTGAECPTGDYGECGE